MADLEFHKKLSEQLNEELQRFDHLERTVARIYFRLEGGDSYSPAEVAKLVRPNPDEVTFIIGKILNHLQQKELVHALPRRVP